jgi:hypothetical protein
MYFRVDTEHIIINIIFLEIEGGKVPKVVQV